MRTRVVTNFLRTIIINAAVYAAALAGGAHAHAAHRYVVAIDPELGRLAVEARLAAGTRTLTARALDAATYLVDAVDCADKRPLRIRGRRMYLLAAPCVRYTVDLERAAAVERRNATLSPTNFVVSPSAWLWRPRLGRDETIEVRFEIDEHFDVFVPWQPVDGQPDTYRLPRSPESSNAAAVFGDFDYVEVAVPGATLRITLLRGNADLDVGHTVDWIRAAAENVALVYGRFPNPSANVVVVPVGSSRRSGSPVPFGRVVRDGGETIELFVNAASPRDAFYDDWTATHEFSHLLLPYLESRHRWIAEGFAQYYQNLLLARAGEYSDERAWQKLVAGFERGRASAPSLSPNEAARNRRAALMKTYWSGAALALLADVELRSRSDGDQSLDTVLDQLQRCCLPSAARWSGPRLFARLDAFLEEPVFVPLYEELADAPGFPNVAPLLAELGVHAEDGAIRLDDDANLAALRRAMTAP